MVLKSIAITGATQANPVVITAAAHGFSDGAQTGITDIVGMTELNERWFEVANATTDTFELSGEDGTSHTAWSSGGYVKTPSYSFNQDVIDLMRLDATLSKIGVGTSATDNITSIKLDKIRSISHMYVYGRLLNAFERADIEQSNLANENPIRYGESYLVLARYIRIMYGGNRAAHEIADKYHQLGNDMIDDVASANVVLLDDAGSIISPKETSTDIMTFDMPVVPLYSKVSGSDADITTLDGRGPEDEFNVL